MKKLYKKIRKDNYEKFTKKVKEIIYNPKYDKLKLYIQHGNTSIYEHSIRVAYISFMIAERFNINVNINNLILGALFHDYVFYDWHTYGDRLHGFHHPKRALINAKRDFNINNEVGDIIRKHMWPLTLFNIPNTKESLIVCFVDKYCSINEVVRGLRK